MIRLPVRGRRSSSRGLTLLEIMVAVGVLALVAMMVYGTLDGMSTSRKNLDYASERHQQGRSALTRMSREIQAAFVSLHRPIDASQPFQKTAFIGTDRSSFDRLDFTSFSHLRTSEGTHESDQNELSYFASRDPQTGVTDLARRESRYIDQYPERGGVVQVLAQDVLSFELDFFDPLTGDWKTSWDTTQEVGAAERLPAQVRIELVLNRMGGEPLRFVTKVPIALQAPLTFGIPR